MIKGIAEQTNLLALNAAIEAARAGEQNLVSNEIAHQVEMIAGMAEGNSRVIGQTAATTDELSTLAGKLSQSVNRYRL